MAQKHNDQSQHLTGVRRWQVHIHHLVHHSLFTGVIMFLILINALIVGLETYPNLYEQYRSWFYLTDYILLWLFTVEILLKLFASRPFSSYFKDGWNLFDFFIVLSGHLFVGAHFVTVLRILRVLRLLRAISIIPSLRRIVNALLLTIPALGNIMLLLGLLFYIFAVLGTMLFGQYEPEYFGSLHATLLTLFQVVTLESWASGVMRPLLQTVPWAWTYFVAFILVGTFVIFNLFVGVIVSNVEKADEEEEKIIAAQQDRQTETANGTTAGKLTPPTEQASEIEALRKEIQELKSLVVELHKQQEKQDKGV
jgi:voltage-gated sodium channel